MKLPPEMLAVINRETRLAQVRSALRDLDSPEAAPRLNAQIRLREEHVEMLKLLLAELARTEARLDQAKERLVDELLSRNPYHW